MHPVTSSLSPHAVDCLEATMAYGDRWYDAEAGLLWNPPGSFTGELDDCSVHVLPPSGWYALGLLLRDGPGDRDRVHTVLDAVLALQYDRPGAVWDGTFARFAEWPEPSPGHDVEWFDYDPNWRQFLGCTLLLVLRHFAPELGRGYEERINGALTRCIEGEPEGRVEARYTNIALMKAALETEAGERFGRDEWIAAGRALAGDIVGRFDRLGSFDEFNSPTYYGVDLLGLGMWRTGPDPVLVEAGRRLEDELWKQVLQWYNPHLGNLCGPYSRAYGTDMHRYVAGMAVWMWAQSGRATAALPDIEQRTVEHGHDLLKGPVAALLARRAGEDRVYQAWAEARERRSEFPLSGGVTTSRRTIERTAWQSPTFMVGAETDSARPHGWLQYHPVVAHWRETPTSIGSFRFVADAPIDGAVEYEGLVVVVHPHGVTGLGEVEVWFEGDALVASAITTNRWALEGLVVDVETDAVLDRVVVVDAQHVRAVYRNDSPHAETTRLLLRFTTPEPSREDDA